MNGIDLLFVIVGLILLLVIWEVMTYYLDWSEWNQNRRRDRQLERYELEDDISEREYRRDLRFIFSISCLTNTFSEFVKAMKKVGDSMNKFNKAISQEKHIL